MNSVYIIDENNVARELAEEQLLEYINNITEVIDAKYLDTERLNKLVYPKLKLVNTLDEINSLIATCAADLSIIHYDYPKISVWHLINDLHKRTFDCIVNVSEKLYSNMNINGNHAPIVTAEYLEYVRKNKDVINGMIDYDRDYSISYFGFRTLERAYLKKVNGKIEERIQHMFMRIAIAIHFGNNRLDLIKQSYDLMSQGYFTHATPTLFNAGSKLQQLSSCFLLGTEDNIESIFECVSKSAVISKYAGGLGVCLSNIRCQGAYINSTQGTASGMRIAKVFNEMVRYANQSGKRAGSIALYIELWHPDVFFFLDLKKNTGAETERARDLFLGVMINDLFMKRVISDDKWSLMCPSQCCNLFGKYGDEFERIYIEYESQGKYIKQVKARDVWLHLQISAFETGVPYMLFKDSINRKSNQINIGVVNGSNLCAEIVEVHNSKEYAVCNLASICLPKFVKNNNGAISFDYQKLMEVSRIVCRNLNNIIDINFYPVQETKTSNLRHRPIGIGVQGLADVFALFRTPFDSDIARDLNKKIFETIYFGALTESNCLAKEKGSYDTFIGSPLSSGMFQFDLWNVNELSRMWDWNSLKKDIDIFGVRNSLVTTCMPTASTSQIMGNNECIEPFTSNLYSRSTLAGNFFIVNKYMVDDLIKLGLWDDDIIDTIKYYEGSIQNISLIPENIKKIYRTVWEIPLKSLIELSADRGPFIDQTQSLNLYLDKIDYPALENAWIYGWKKGLKTGMYYLHTKPSSEAIKFGIDVNKIKEIELIDDEEEEAPVCRMEEGCITCSA